MDILFAALTIFGLSLFEIISSIDNAVINAEVLSTMGQKARRFFLTWGLFFAVFLMRGILPFLIVWATIPGLGPIGTITATFSNDPKIAETIEHSSYVLLLGGGVFLVFLFFHWLFLEAKNYGLRGERFFHQQGAWFYAVISILLSALVWFALQKEPLAAFGVVLGSTAFFITHGFRTYAEQQEQKMLGTKSNISDLSKILYLEVIDASFSIDGVVGAFAFTFSIPLIFLGNGLGAIALRQITVSNIERIKKYKYLKNGAMYSILFLGSIMIMEGFAIDIPQYITPILTFLTIGYFFYKSKIEVI
ncbi:MAG: DUF475 domain-containing protein [Candidatus Levybacteria bacterium]|nr:DUF475 domain-containing protein [Candidatus Levybacteria bacterium]